MTLHREIHFETDICNDLMASGWLYAEGDAKRFDRERAVFAPDLIDWIKATQPQAWDGIAKMGEAALLDRVRKQLDSRGTLDVLRHGIDMVGVRGTLLLAQFKPALMENPEIVARYHANRLRVVRQVRYSTAKEDSIDLVLFLNGLPVATAELKTDFTQCVGDAIDQYRFDRPPRTMGRGAEPLLSPLGGALVHFAVSSSEVFMTTKLEGKETFFLPFNKGNAGGKGNEVNPNGYATDYLWREVWARDSWLELIGRYIIPQKSKKGLVEKYIFPRYHQLEATRALLAKVLEEGPGKKYLIQHSAGSGKTNSIAWSAHFLADLHDANHRKMFDTVIVVSDRKVIDGQLQDAIFSFERTVGVVETIKGKGGSKSGELAQALAAGKKIVVCTIQTFPHALKEVRRLAATEGKTFAVIADEAHSSQTGEAASKLKEALTAEELEDLRDGGEVSTEDILVAQMAARANDTSVTYVAFTATPKGKTLELFGRPTDPNAPAGPNNKPLPFHLYSMRQAVEEGFILDVLQNYTPYSLAFRLASKGQDLSEDAVERDKAMRGLMQWVRLHPHNISQKVLIVVEHFRENVQHLLDGKAKAMVVLQSRKEAVRWKLAIDKYIKSKGYDLGTLVAFSGGVDDKESGPNEFSEGNMNGDLKGQDLKDVFNTDEFHILLVANKYQTGFDQPLLSAMYVDRRLAGVQAVQTLSRLNRAYAKDGIVKEKTYVLDFSDSSEEVLKAFSSYYGRAELETVTDPDLIFDLRAKLDATGYYDSFEVNRVADVFATPGATQSQLTAAIAPVSQRLLDQHTTARKSWIDAREAGNEDAAKAARDEMEHLTLFRGDMQTFRRMYAFLSQIFDYVQSEVEKRDIFYSHLIRLLKFEHEREEVDLSGVKLTHHKLTSKGKRHIFPGEALPLAPMTAPGSGKLRDPEKLLLLEIIEKLNGLFEGDFSDEDQLGVVFGPIRGSLLKSSRLTEQAVANTKEQFATSPALEDELFEALLGADTSVDAYRQMVTQAMANESTRRGILTVLLEKGRLWESLREAR